MSKRASFRWLLFSLALSILSSVYPQLSFIDQKDLTGSDITRDKRYEGIRRYQNVSAKRFALKSALIQYQEESLQNPEHFKLSFYVDTSLTSRNIFILIEDNMEILYYMIPFRKNWETGFQVFQWSSAFANQHGINGVEQFYGKALVERTEPIIIVPIVLYHTNLPDQVNGYEFIFISTDLVNVEYKFLDENNRTLTSGTLKDKPPHQKIRITWNSEALKPGKYLLWVRYTFTENEYLTSEDTYAFFHNNYTH